MKCGRSRQGVFGSPASCLSAASSSRLEKTPWRDRNDDQGQKYKYKGYMMSDNVCDLLVIGGGPGGYAAAIRGAQRGLKVMLVERGAMGGTCLNRGCIPTKTLLEDTLTIARVRNSHFLSGEMKISRKRMIERKNTVIQGAIAGITATVKGYGAEIVEGSARFTSPKSVEVETRDGEKRVITSDKIIIATGAREDYGSDVTIDGRNILSTDDALRLESIPRSLAVVGAGNRGIEFATIYHNLGTKVVVIEKEKQVLPRMDWELADRLKRSLIDRKIKILTGTKVVAITSNGDEGVSLGIETNAEQQIIKVGKVLLTGMRRPSYLSLNLYAAGLSPGEEGVLAFRPGQQTAVEHIYVVGDAAGPPYLAHKAIAQGMAAVDHIMGSYEEMKPLLVPNCIYGDPEVASIGLSVEEALAEGTGVKTGEFHFIGNGRANSAGDARGSVTIVSESKTGAILGVHMIGPRVTELISIAALAMQNGVGVEGIKKTVFAHPTLAETFFEAALTTDNEAIHLLVEGEEHE
jgi:dihydrolipoamide dehydrogenase